MKSLLLTSSNQFQQSPSERSPATPAKEFANTENNIPFIKVDNQLKQGESSWGLSNLDIIPER